LDDFHLGAGKLLKSEQVYIRDFESEGAAEAP